VIRTAAKETNPDCILWLTCFDITHPHIVDSRMFREIDWLMNEEGDVAKIDSIRGMVGENTRLITCLANWNQKDPVKVVADALKTTSDCTDLQNRSPAPCSPLSTITSQILPTASKAMKETLPSWQEHLRICPFNM
jgi:hypothetical protein